MYEDTKHFGAVSIRRATKSFLLGSPIEDFLPSGDLVFPVNQHIGKPAKPIVKKGDAVLAGQLIAEADGFVSANIVSSCSGTVKAIEERHTTSGGRCRLHRRSLMTDQFNPARRDRRRSRRCILSVPGHRFSDAIKCSRDRRTRRSRLSRHT